MAELNLEQKRALLQRDLDSHKSQSQRNELGQFATPVDLARDIVRYGLSLFGKEIPIRFLDPAFGTGVFYSALREVQAKQAVETARGFEIDPLYGIPTQELWNNTHLELDLSDFTKASPPKMESTAYNLLICNPPYVRHHHLDNGEKIRLKARVKEASGIQMPGLAGLYCYFIGLSHAWMQSGGIAGWLIPSEFMDVNYGTAVKTYLLEKVTLIRIHRFDPNDLQFSDAFVSSSVVWFRNDSPPVNNNVEFTFGGSLFSPSISRVLSVNSLREETKWTRFPKLGVRKSKPRVRLSDLFTIKRGIATGGNKFFILTPEQIKENDIPEDFLRPILPSPRYLFENEIISDEKGNPLLDNPLFLLDCDLPEAHVRERYQNLWTYLMSGKDEISKRYLSRSRKVWYFQEKRSPAPILMTYMGRRKVNNKSPFRFILNQSKAIATNVYLLLYPNPEIMKASSNDETLVRQIWEVLNSLNPSSLIGEGRVYGGGLHKLEPKELGNVDASSIAQILENKQISIQSGQLSFLND